MTQEMEKELNELKIDICKKCIAFRGKWFDDPNGFQFIRVQSSDFSEPTKIGFAINYDMIKAPTK